MSWFVITDLGWDGEVASKYEDEEEARKHYQESCNQVETHYTEGCVLLKGEVVEENKFSW